MKTRHLVAALFLVLSLCTSTQSTAQGVASLYISDMPGFPDLPQDSAYEGLPYTYDIILINNTNIFINSTISLTMKVDSATSTFLTNPQTAIPPGDTVVLTVSGFNFTQPFFKVGNNIVVVWPVVNGFVVPIDTFQTNVHFVPLNSLGGIDLTEPAYHLFPVPSNEFLHLDVKSGEVVEYVRIYTISGQLVREIPVAEENQIDIGFLNPGVYVLEITANGKSSRRKFIKQ